MLRDILVHVEDTNAGGSVVDFAVKLAFKHEARLTGIALKPIPPYYYAMGGAAGMPPFDEMKIVERAKQRFESATADSPIETAWRETGGPALRDLALHARFADLTIIGQGDPDSHFRGIASELVVRSGQPAILVPYGWSGDAVTSRALVAWNSTRESARALHDALPLLEATEYVRVVTVKENGGEGESAEVGLDIAAHLGIHGIKADLVYAPICDDAGRELLHRAAENDCDLLVMGLYGHSRLSGLIFRGASRTVLEHMTLPVMMSH